MRIRSILPSGAVIAAGAIAVGCWFIWRTSFDTVSRYDVIQASPRIDPEYGSLVVPPDFAPLNFIIREPGVGFYTDIHDSQGNHIIVKSVRPMVQIPEERWRRLLSQNRGREIFFDIYTKGNNGAWKRFAPCIDTVSHDDIDHYLAYRLMPPLYSRYGTMGIYQRTLSSFKEKPLWLNRMSGYNCMNCHSFKNNDPEYMLMHMRGGKGKGTLIKRGNNVFNLNTGTAFNKPGAFPAWHPSGAIIAFSVNRVRQFFHATGEPREGFDRKSKIIIYNLSTNTISSPPALHNPNEMPTQPEWSPDGSYLYYCCAPQYPEDSLATYYTRIFYDLRRIRYWAEKDLWGEPETVLSHEKTGLSISFPKISPDGKFLLCCMARYGTFPVFRPGGDICLLTLKTGQYRRLEINSEEPESFPNWSSNGRWFVFSSKRLDGICARPFFCHIDSNGNVSKPALLPQKDPRFYSSFLQTYNLSTLVKGPVRLTPQAMVTILENGEYARNAQLSLELKKELAQTPLPENAMPDTLKSYENNAILH
jgi:Tol biopolymer transport system component